jgi:hypothetical protein
LAANYTVLAVTPDSTRALDGASYYIDEINVVDTPTAVTPPSTAGLTILNFDESTPATLDAFEGTSFAAISDGTNKVAQLTKPTSAKAWGGATFLSCPSGTIGKIPSIPFTASDQTISVRVKAPRTGVTFSLEAKDVNNPGNLVFAEATNSTTEWETLSFNFANKTFGTAIDPNQTYNMLSIFPNFSKSNEGSATAETSNNIYLIDDVKLVGSTATLAACPAASVATSPSVAAANPTAANLVTLFSDASGYTAVPNGSFRTDWSSATFAAETVASNNVLKYSALDYVGIEPANPIDISTATHVNMDIWTPDLTKFRVKLVNFLNGTYNEATNKEHEVTLTLDDTQRSTWYRVRIPMAEFTGLTERTHVKQLILSVGDGVKGTVYVDNIFFSSN